MRRGRDEVSSALGVVLWLGWRVGGKGVCGIIGLWGAVSELA